MASASSKYVVWKFRVGSTALLLDQPMKKAVPYFCHGAMFGWICVRLMMAVTCSVSLSRSCTWIAPVPRMAIALSFFEPMTAPCPVRPA